MSGVIDAFHVSSEEAERMGIKNKVSVFISRNRRFLGSRLTHKTDALWQNISLLLQILSDQIEIPFGSSEINEWRSQT